MYKIKKTIKHVCVPRPVSSVLIGVEEKPEGNEPAWGMLSQCIKCGAISVKPIEQFVANKPNEGIKIKEIETPKE